jgi:hypothetical protein
MLIQDARIIQAFEGETRQKTRDLLHHFIRLVLEEQVDLHEDAAFEEGNSSSLANCNLEDFSFEPYILVRVEAIVGLERRMPEKVVSLDETSVEAYNHLDRLELGVILHDGTRIELKARDLILVQEVAIDVHLLLEFSTLATQQHDCYGAGSLDPEQEL